MRSILEQRNVTRIVMALVITALILKLSVYQLHPDLSSFLYEEEEPEIAIFVDEPLSDDPLFTPFGNMTEVIENCPIRDVTRCLEFLRTVQPLKRNSTAPIIFHTAWGGKIVPVQTFLLNSFLTTQNLRRSLLVYWIEKKSFETAITDPILAPFMKRSNIVFKCLDIYELAKDTPLDLARYHNETIRDHVESLLNVTNNALFGDLVRILLLYKYGGIYVDVDVILLRSFAPLTANEFGETWSGFSELNTAVFSLKARGHTASTLLKSIINEKRKNFHPQVLYPTMIAHNLSIVIYPTTFFDPSWPIIDLFSRLGNLPFKKFKEMFNKARANVPFWEGAFAYHFHNQYNVTQWKEDSWIGQLEEKWKQKISRFPKKIKIPFLSPMYDDLLSAKCR